MDSNIALYVHLNLRLLSTLLLIESHSIQLLTLGDLLHSQVIQRNVTFSMIYQNYSKVKFWKAKEHSQLLQNNRMNGLVRNLSMRKTLKSVFKNSTR